MLDKTNLDKLIQDLSLMAEHANRQCEYKAHKTFHHGLYEGKRLAFLESIEIIKKCFTNNNSSDN